MNDRNPAHRRSRWPAIAGAVSLAVTLVAGCDSSTSSPSGTKAAASQAPNAAPTTAPQAQLPPNAQPADIAAKLGCAPPNGSATSNGATTVVCHAGDTQFAIETFPGPARMQEALRSARDFTNGHGYRYCSGGKWLVTANFGSVQLGNLSAAQRASETTLLASAHAKVGCAVYTF